MSQRTIRNLQLAATVATILAIPVEAVAATDIFLELNGIPGESEDDRFKGTIDVLSWSWGLHEGDKSGACIEDLSLRKWHDISTPKLAEAMSNDTVIPEGTLYVRKSGDKPVTYITLELSNIRVKSLSMGGEGSDYRFTDNVSFTFDEVVGTYVPQDATGAPRAPVPYFIPNNCK